MEAPTLSAAEADVKISAKLVTYENAPEFLK